MYALIRPLLFRLDPETSHRLTFILLRLLYRVPGFAGFLHRLNADRTPRLPVKLLGTEFPNPVGLAAGLDKNAELIRAFADMGFGWVEAGTVTPRASLAIRARASSGSWMTGRSIRVFVLGEAERPGSYTVSGLSTITNALFASGGVKSIGSLRNIQLKRNGALVTRLDLYYLLLNGGTSNDVRLQPGDVIFIPPVGRRPA